MRLHPLVSIALALTVAIALLAGAPAPKRTTKPQGMRAALPAAAPADPAEITDTALQAALTRIAAAAPGRCGIVALHVNSGRIARVHAVDRMPMASTCKLPIALAVLDAIDHGRLAMDKRVLLRAQDMVPGMGGLGEKSPRGGITLKVHDLLNAMIVHSDNTACDALLAQVGGPGAVSRWLLNHHVPGIRIERSELELGNDWYGLTQLPPAATWSAGAIAKLRTDVAPTAHTTASEAFLHDPRDTGSPEAFATLLARLCRRELLSRTATDTLLAMMARVRTGNARLRAGLPPQVRVYDKTGTAGTWRDRTPCVNDVGILQLPGGGGTVVIAVMIRDVHGPVANAEKTIAAAARAVFTAWNAPE